MRFINYLQQTELAFFYAAPAILAGYAATISLWLIPVGLVAGVYGIGVVHTLINTLISDFFYEEGEMAKELEEADKAFWGSWLKE
jgi:hypothetical protein